MSAKSRTRDTDIDPETFRLAGYQAGVSDQIAEADVRELMRTHTRGQLRFGPDGTLTPVEN